jgi:hypothetical protein
VSAQDTSALCPKTFTALLFVYDSLSINMTMPDMNVCIPTGSNTVNATVTLPGYASYLTADYGPRYRLTKLSGPSAGPGTIVATWYATTTVLPGLAAGQYTYKIAPLENSPFADEMACSSGPNSDTFSINVYNATGANAGTDQNVTCIQNYSLAGNVIPSPSYGTWAQISGPTALQFSNVHSPNPSVGNNSTIALSGTYMFSWTTSDSNNACQIYKDTVIVVASSNCSFPLPLEMTAFNVEKVNDMAMLKWTTATEENLESFFAEWSITGGRNNDWQAIGALRAKGGTSGANYSMMHRPTPGSVNYYRIRIAERDGHYSYSPIATLALDGNEAVPQVYPTPVTDILQVSNLKAGSRLSLYSLEGMLLWNGVTDGNKAYIDMSTWRPGMYVLRIQTQHGSRNLNYKVIKK